MWLDKLTTNGINKLPVALFPLKNLISVSFVDSAYGTQLHAQAINNFSFILILSLTKHGIIFSAQSLVLLSRDAACDRLTLGKARQDHRMRSRATDHGKVKGLWSGGAGYACIGPLAISPPRPALDQVLLDV